MTVKSIHFVGLMIMAGTICTASAQAAVTNVGTLTCTLSPSAESASEARTIAKASCHFDAITGTDIDLEGTITRVASQAERDAKVVLVWSVVAQSVDVSAKNLTGRFTGVMGGTPTAANRDVPTGTLFATGEKGIQLRPIAGDPASLPDAGLTVLELDIATVKA